MPASKVGVLQEDHPMYREGYKFTSVCECGFASFGWPTEEQATERNTQHQSEHENAAAIREHLDNQDYESANALMMPSIKSVEAKTPDAFPELVSSPTQDDVNSAWNAVS